MKQKFIFTENLEGYEVIVNLDDVRNVMKIDDITSFEFKDGSTMETIMDFEALKDHIQSKY